MRKYFATLLFATAAVTAVGLRPFLSTGHQQRGVSVLGSAKASVNQPLQTRSWSLPSGRARSDVANATTRTIGKSPAQAAANVSGTAVVVRGGTAASGQDGTSRSQNTV